MIQRIKRRGSLRVGGIASRLPYVLADREGKLVRLDI